MRVACDDGETAIVQTIQAETKNSPLLRHKHVAIISVAACP